MKSPYVDLLGNLKSEISSLRAESEQAKAALISLAVDHPGTACAIEGNLFRAVVSWTDKKVVDYRKVFEELSAKHGIQPEFIDGLVRKHTRVAEQMPVVRVGALKEAT